MKDLLKIELLRIKNNHLDSIKFDPSLTALKKDYSFLDLEEILTSSYDDYLQPFFEEAQEDFFLNSVIIAAEKEVDFLVNFDYRLQLHIDEYNQIKFKNSNASFYQFSYLNNLTFFKWSLFFYNNAVTFSLKNIEKNESDKNTICLKNIFNLLVSFLSDKLIMQSSIKHQVTKKFSYSNKETSKIYNFLEIRTKKISPEVIQVINEFDQKFNLLGDNLDVLLALNEQCNLLYDYEAFNISNYYK